MEHENLNETQNGNSVKADISRSILSVANGWGEASSFIKVGHTHEKIKIVKIEKESKIIGKGYYNDLTLDCYVAYGEDGTRLIEINEGANVEIRYYH